MKVKEDILNKWESGEYTIYDLADEYTTTPEVILELLGIVENPF
jgi:hypothetical protein